MFALKKRLRESWGSPPPSPVPLKDGEACTDMDTGLGYFGFSPFGLSLRPKFGLYFASQPEERIVITMTITI